MNHSSVAQLVSSIKFSLLRKRFICYAPYSRINIQLLKILYHEGYIRGFRVIDNKRILVYLKITLSSNSTILDLFFFPQKNRYSHIKYSQLVSLYGLKTFCILSTDIGLLTINQCFLLKKGDIYF